MAFSGVLVRSSRPFSRQIRGFFHGRPEGGCLFSNFGSPSLSNADQQRQTPAIPVMNGNAVSLQISDTAPDQSVDASAEELLKSFEVASSLDIANRLFEGIEVRMALSKRKSTEESSTKRRSYRPMPVLSDQMMKHFGTGENITALVCRFGRMAYDIAQTEDHAKQRGIVTSAVQEVLGIESSRCLEVDDIVDAVSGAQQQKMHPDVTYTPSHVVRFLSFANVWRKLDAEQQRLITTGQTGSSSSKMTTYGLVEGLKVFEKSWESLTPAEQSLAQANLCRMAKQNQSDFSSFDASDASPAASLQHV